MGNILITVLVGLATEITTIVVLYLLVIKPLKRDVAKLEKSNRICKRALFITVNSVKVMIKDIIPPDTDNKR